MGREACPWCAPAREIYGFSTSARGSARIARIRPIERGLYTVLTQRRDTWGVVPQFAPSQYCSVLSNCCRFNPSRTARRTLSCSP